MYPRINHSHAADLVPLQPMISDPKHPFKTKSIVYLILGKILQNNKSSIYVSNLARADCSCGGVSD